MESAIYMAGGAEVLSPPLMIPPGMLRGGRVSFQYEQPDGNIVKVSYKVKTRNEADKRSRTKSISSNFKNRFTNWRKSIGGSGMRRRSLSMDDISAYENRPLPPIPSKKVSLKDEDHPYDRPKYRPGNMKRHSSYNPTQQFGGMSFAPSNNGIQEETNGQQDNSDDIYIDMNMNSEITEHVKPNEGVTLQHEQSKESLEQFDDTYEIPTQYKQKVVRRPKPSPVRSRLARQTTIEESVSHVPRDAPKVDINPRFLKRSYSCDALTLLSQWELFQEFCNNTQDVFSPIDQDSSDSDSDMEYDRKRYLRQKSGRMSFSEALFRNEEREEDYEDRKIDLFTSFDTFDIGKPRKRSSTLPEKFTTQKNNDNALSKNVSVAEKAAVEPTKGTDGKTIVKEEIWV